MIAKHVLNIGRLLTKIAVVAPLIVEVGRRCLKASRQLKRSTKPADGLTLESFDLAWTERILYREARRKLERSVATHPSATDASGKRNHQAILKRALDAALNSLRPTLSPRAEVS